MTTTHESLYKTKWVELMKRISDENGEYIYIREPWLIDGNAISILPFRWKDDHYEYLLRCEFADTLVSGTVKGGCDKVGENLIDCAVRELREETGYVAKSPDLIPLGTARASKLTATTMNLFAVDVTKLLYEYPEGDGTLNEANAYCKWVLYGDIVASQDPMVHATIMRYHQKLVEERG